VPVPKKLFHYQFLEGLKAAFVVGKRSFFADLAALISAAAFTRYVPPLRRAPWVVYAKAPFAGSQQALAYLTHYTHRVAIANSRLPTLNDVGVLFRWTDYRPPAQCKVMALTPMRSSAGHQGVFERLRVTAGGPDELISNGSNSAWRSASHWAADAP
jgi:hypothetical protein